MRWLANSGQLWKLFVAGVLGVVSLGFSCAPSEWFLAESVVHETARDFIGIGLAALIPAWIAYSVKCPSCGARSLGAVRRRAKFTRLAEEFLALESCPECGYPNKSQR